MGLITRAELSSLYDDLDEAMAEKDRAVSALNEADDAVVAALTRIKGYLDANLDPSDPDENATPEQTEKRDSEKPSGSVGEEHVKGDTTDK